MGLSGMLGGGQPTLQAEAAQGSVPQLKQCAERGVVQRGWAVGRGPPLGPYPSWMNSSRAAHSDTSWGSPLLSTTKDRMGSRSSAPLLDRGTLAGQLQRGQCSIAQTAEPPLRPLKWSGACGLLSPHRPPRSGQTTRLELCASSPAQDLGRPPWWKGKDSCNFTSLPHAEGQKDEGNGP